MSRIEELEKKLEENRAARQKAEDAQYEIDLEARIALEEEHGTIAIVKVSKFTPGQPTRAFLRTPSAPEYKRYKAQMYAAAKAEGKARVSAQDAQEMLAKSCWVYPATEDARQAMLAVFPGLLSPLSLAAAALAEGKTEDEGKG